MRYNSLETTLHDLSVPHFRDATNDEILDLLTLFAKAVSEDGANPATPFTARSFDFYVQRHLDQLGTTQGLYSMSELVTSMEPLGMVDCVAFAIEAVLQLQPEEGEEDIEELATSIWDRLRANTVEHKFERVFITIATIAQAGLVAESQDDEYLSIEKSADHLKSIEVLPNSVDNSLPRLISQIPTDFVDAVILDLLELLASALQPGLA